MATVPSLHTYTTGEVVTAATLNGQLGATWGAFVESPPSAQLRQTVAQSIGSGGAALLFDTEETDNDNGHSTSSNTSRYTAQTAGTLLCAGQVGWVANATTTSTRWAEWRLNGTVVAGSRIWLPQSSNATDQTIIPARTMRIPVSVNDYVELWGGSPAGATNTYVANAYGQSAATFQWVST